MFLGKMCLNVWSVARTSMLLHLSSARGHNIDHPKKLSKSTAIAKTYKLNEKDGE